jgi:hypothetical protein
MKRLSLFCALLLVVGATAGAHDGAISLYRDATLASCSMEITPGGQGTLTMLYVRDQGTDMGSAAEFRIYCTSMDIVFFTPTWEPYITLIDATIPGNVSIAGASQFGCGLGVVPFGTVRLLNAGDIDTFHVKIVENPTSFPVPAVKITACDEDNTEVTVIGGTFVLTGNQAEYPANCNPATESKTWGAIKSMYR